MKLVNISARKFGLNIKRYKKISGACPKCGYSINNFLRTSCVYECPCGYFSYYADKDLVIYDPADHPEEYWKLRAQRRLIIDGIRAAIKYSNFFCENFPDHKLDLRERLRLQIARMSEFNKREKNKLEKYNLHPIEFKEIELNPGDFSDSPNIPPAGH
jgi:hypothetical protein